MKEDQSIAFAKDAVIDKLREWVNESYSETGAIKKEDAKTRKLLSELTVQLNILDSKINPDPWELLNELSYYVGTDPDEDDGKVNIRVIRALRMAGKYDPDKIRDRRERAAELLLYKPGNLGER